VHGGRDVSPVAAKLAAELGVDLTAVAGTGPGGRIMVSDVQAVAAARPAAPAAVDAKPPRILAAPKAKRLAQELGVDLASVAGSGPDGLITAEDVQAAAAASLRRAASAPKQPLPMGEIASAHTTGFAMTNVEPLSRLRQAIAERMIAAKQQAPHFYLMADVEMTQAQRLRAHLQAVQPAVRPPSYTDMIVRAAALAFKAKPQLNVNLVEGGLARRAAIDIGVAVSLEDGLIVPVIRGADRLSLREISQAQRAATERARGGRLRPDDLGDKSLTVSNLGMHGVDAFVAILDQPAPMILAVGRVADRVVAVAGQATVRPMCTFTLSVDHRVLDGVQAAEFLMLVKGHIENPYELMGDKP
jgi:pyruvate dehydrogenase E2 component (dihydrolipoamide acetyltransferase)